MPSLENNLRNFYILIKVLFFYWDRMAPLVALQKKVYMSILRKELPRLVALTSGASNHQSLQNIVC